MSPSTNQSDIPILKVGAVVVRAQGSQILILRPIPKHAGEMPHLVLPRGSRQYQDAAGEWHDARDVATGKKYAAALEPFARALEREIEEEAGVTPAMLSRARVIEMGEMDFESRTKGIYPIHWFVVALAEADAATLTDTLPVDSLALRWATFDEIKTMAACGAFSAGYVPVIEAALIAISPSPSSG